MLQTASLFLKDDILKMLPAIFHILIICYEMLGVAYIRE